MKDRLYLVESHDYSSTTYGPSPYEDTQTPGRRIFVLSLQGETLQVCPIPARQWYSFSNGELFCFDGKLLAPMRNSLDDLSDIEFVALV